MTQIEDWERWDAAQDRARFVLTPLAIDGAVGVNYVAARSDMRIVSGDPDAAPLSARLATFEPLLGRLMINPLRTLPSASFLKPKYPGLGAPVVEVAGFAAPQTEADADADADAEEAFLQLPEHSRR